MTGFKASLSYFLMITYAIGVLVVGLCLSIRLCHGWRGWPPLPFRNTKWLWPFIPVIWALPALLWPLFLPGSLVYTYCQQERTSGKATENLEMARPGQSAAPGEAVELVVVSEHFDTKQMITDLRDEHLSAHLERPSSSRCSSFTFVAESSPTLHISTREEAEEQDDFQSSAVRLAAPNSKSTYPGSEFNNSTTTLSAYSKIDGPVGRSEEAHEPSTEERMEAGGSAAEASV